MSGKGNSRHSKSLKNHRVSLDPAVDNLCVGDCSRSTASPTAGAQEEQGSIALKNATFALYAVRARGLQPSGEPLLLMRRQRRFNFESIY
jgi:hypothetical protein